MEFSVLEIQEATGARRVCGEDARVCRSCAIDSRAVERDGLFVAFAGEKVDGNDFAPQAIEAGAAAVVLTREADEELCAQAAAHRGAVFVVEDAEEFLLRLAHRYRENLGCAVVGITGSIGKTTTKDMIATVLDARYRVFATKGNFNSLIGLPLTVLAAPEETEVLVLEMGMNAAGEIERLSRCAAPSVAVITKVGTSHIGMLGSRENIARAKAEIVYGLASTPEGAVQTGDPVLVLPAEDDFASFICDEFAAPARVEVVYAGVAADDAPRASAIELDAEGRPHFTLTLSDGSAVEAKLATMGAQSVSNAVLAAAVGERFGMAALEIAQALEGAAITGRRQELRCAHIGARVIDDSYNASPESTAAALDLLRMLPASGRRVAVLGEIGELGAEAPRLHGLVGAYAAATKPDALVCVGDSDAKEMAAAARTMGMPARVVTCLPDAARATAWVQEHLAPDDIMLVKGSRFVELDRLVEEVC